MFLWGVGAQEKRDVQAQWAFEGQKWILGSSVGFLGICAWTPVSDKSEMTGGRKKKSGSSKVFELFPSVSVCMHEVSPTDSKTVLHLPLCVTKRREKNGIKAWDMHNLGRTGPCWNSGRALLVTGKARQQLMHAGRRKAELHEHHSH